MSASQQKKTRSQKRDGGMDKRQAAKKKAYTAAKKERRNVTIVSIVLAVVIIVLVAFNSSLLYNNFAAVQIDDVSFTASDYSYFYKSSYYNYTSYYESIGMLDYIGLDTSTSLSSQAYPYGEDMTWADYFKDSALSSMESISMLWSEANEAGFTLDEEAQAGLDETLEGLKTIHEDSDYPTASRYIATLYGKGLTVERVSRLVEMSIIADAYAELKYDSFTYTDEEIEAHYVENEDDFDTFNFLSYFVSGAADEENGIDSETAMATAMELADSILADDVTTKPDDNEAGDDTDTNAEANADTDTDTDADADTEAETGAEDTNVSSEESAFKQKVLALTQAEPTEVSELGSGLSSYPEAAIDWVRDSARAYADKTVIESDAGYYVLFFIARDGNEYETVDARHILFSVEAETDEDGNSVYTDEAKAAALQEAEDALAEWKSGDMTEDSFAELANTYSDDTGSNTTGGLYEEILKGNMVAEFNDWIFDPARKVGDTGIVFNEGSYCGYHVMYFSGFARIYRGLLSEGDLRSTAYENWNTAQLESYTASTGFTAFLVK